MGDLRTETSEVESISVFRFECLTEFLGALAESKSRRRGFSHSRWAQQLGYRSPRSVGMVLRGSRLPTQEFLSALCRLENYTQREKHYLELLLRQERLRRRGVHSSGQGAANLAEEIRKMRSQHGHAVANSELPPDRYASIADWCAQAIWILADCGDFARLSREEQVRWLKSRLGGNCTIAEIGRAMEHLLQSEFLQIHPEHKNLVPKARVLFSSSNNTPSKALRAHHRQMLRLAEEAIEGQLFSERLFLGRMFLLRKRDFERAGRELKEFLDQFMAKYSIPAGESLEEGDEVYELHTGFFKITAARSSSP